MNRLLSTPRRNALAITAGAGLVCVTALFGILSGSADAAQGTPPPWAPGGVSQDANGVGGLEFFNAAGVQITSGSTTAAPFAAFTVGLKPTRTTVADTKATLFAYVPQVGQTPDQWTTNEQIGLSTDFPVTTAPAPANTTTLPVETGGSGDTKLATVATDLPNTSTTAGYVNAYEIRMYTGAKFQPTSTTYDYADITINPTTHVWTQVFSPDNALPGGGDTGSPTDTPTSPTDTPTSPSDTPTSPSDTPTSPSDTPTSPSDTPTSPSDTPTSPSDGGSSTTPTGGGSSTSTAPTTGDVTAVDSDGTTLGDDPDLALGETVTLTVTGFAANESVPVTLHSTPIDLGSATADASGTVSFAFTVPADLELGSHHVDFDGAANSGLFAFTAIAAGSAHGSGGGSVANTGFDSLLVGGGGLALLAFGGLLLVTGGRFGRPLTGRHAR